VSERTHVAAVASREPARAAAKVGKAQRAHVPAPAARQSALSSVHDVLEAPGESLDELTLRAMQRSFAFDFGRVRVHTNAAAAESARHLDAAAYTVGPHLVFGQSQYEPATEEGQQLIAHELAHVVQQRSAGEVKREEDVEVGETEDRFEREARSHAAEVSQGGVVPLSAPLERPRLQRSILGSFFSDLFSLSPGPFKAIGRAFGSENYSDDELQKYLKFLATAKRIEDHYDSDNKARAVVKLSTQKKPGFYLTSPVKLLLIREMDTGHVSGADEQGILSVVRDSSDQDLKQIFGAGGIDPMKLYNDLSGDAAKALRAVYKERFEGGMKAVKAGSREIVEHVQTPYSKTNLDAVIDQRVRRIEAAAAAAKPDSDDSEEGEQKDADVQQLTARKHAANSTGRDNAEDLIDQLSDLSVDDRNLADEEIAARRDKSYILSLDLNDNQGEPADPAQKPAWQTRYATARGTVRMLDRVMDSLNQDIAMAAPDQKADFEKLTTPLTAAQKQAAKEALEPLTSQSVAQRAKKDAEPDSDDDEEEEKKPKPKFIPGALPGEKKNYLQLVQERAPKIIDERYKELVVGHGEKEHSDPKLTHKLSEMESIAKAGQEETDAVFGSFIPGGHGKPLPVDKFFPNGKIKTPGKIHDAWMSEEAKRTPDYELESAKFWMFYLMQNDTDEDGISSINFKHQATPKFRDDTIPLNAEARTIAKVANRFIRTDKKRLFEIGRGWPAFNTGKGNISLQLFKDPDETKDRAFLWDQFATVIHEYLHSLAHRKYRKFADDMGGESSTEGNTLHEGVDSLLTETAWLRAKPRASLPEIREKVEPDAFHAGKPFDSSLLPNTEDMRYDTFPNAVRLVSVVGVRNLYAAYFYGDVKLIGGPS
jgi:hypothetical protein